MVWRKGYYFIHDCALTPNHLCLMVWPLECNIERLRKGGHHWAYNYEQPVYWYVIPWRAKNASEVKVFRWKNGMPIHTSSSYENADGKIIIDSSLVHGNAFPFFRASHKAKHVIDLTWYDRSPLFSDPDDEEQQKKVSGQRSSKSWIYQRFIHLHIRCLRSLHPKHNSFAGQSILHPTLRYNCPARKSSCVYRVNSRKLTIASWPRSSARLSSMSLCRKNLMGGRTFFRVLMHFFTINASRKPVSSFITPEKIVSSKS